MIEKRYFVNGLLYLCDNDLSNTLNIFECADLLNQLTEENEQLKQKVDFYKYFQKDARELEKENELLRQMIKENVFGRYEEGSLMDLEFKAIAYDDIVRLEISDESELKVIVICKQGKKESVKSFCRMFIPFGVCYEIKEE